MAFRHFNLIFIAACGISTADKCCYSGPKDCDSSDDWCSKSVEQCKNCDGFLVADAVSDGTSAAKNTTNNSSSIASGAGDTETLMLVATSPEVDPSNDAGAASDAVALDSKTFSGASEHSNDQTAAEEKLAWCQREYVSATDCDSWVADQMARKAARKADERKRREERRKDEEARRQARHADHSRQDFGGSNANEVEPLMLVAMSQASDASSGASASRCCYSSPKDCDSSDDWCSKSAEQCKNCDGFLVADTASDAGTSAAKNTTKSDAVPTDSSPVGEDEAENPVASSDGDAEPLMLVAASPESDTPDDAGAESDAVSAKSEASNDASQQSNVQTAAEERLAWCQREYVSAKECDSWVADQMARKAARKADERKRREERRKDEEARRQARLSDERENSVGSNANEEEPLMLAATSPVTSPVSDTSDDAGAESDSMSPGSEASEDASEHSSVQTAVEEKLAWCQREYVSAKECDSWVADQMARKAARKADERKRREERRKDEEARRHARLADKIENSAESSGPDGAGPLMLPALGPQHAIAFLVSFVVGCMLVAFSARTSIQLRWCRNRAQVALLDDVAHV